MLIPVKLAAQKTDTEDDFYKVVFAKKVKVASLVYVFTIPVKF